MNGRITATKVAATSAALSPEDRLIVEHLAVTKLLSGAQLQRLLGKVTVSDQQQLRRRLRGLVEQGVVTRLGHRIGGVRAGSTGYIYALDVLGQRIVHPTDQHRRWRRPWTPSLRILQHTLAVSDLYVRLHEAARSQQLELLAFTTEPSCWRSFAGPGGGRQILKPDAHTIVATHDAERHFWIEVDRNTESLTWITQKAKAYTQYFHTGREQDREGIFPIALWIAPDSRRANGLTDALSRLPADQWQLHQVTTTDRALAALTGDAQPIAKATS